MVFTFINIFKNKKINSDFFTSYNIDKPVLMSACVLYKYLSETVTVIDNTNTIKENAAF